MHTNHTRMVGSMSDKPRVLQPHQTRRGWYTTPDKLMIVYTILYKKTTVHTTLDHPRME